jgi:hypothetical protein
LATVIRGGFRFTFTAPVVGRLSVRWSGTHTVKHHRRSVTVATLSTRIAKAGTARETLKLSAASKAWLRSLKAAKLTTQATVAPSSGAPRVAARRTIHLSR